MLVVILSVPFELNQRKTSLQIIQLNTKYTTVLPYKNRCSYVGITSGRKSETYVANALYCACVNTNKIHTVCILMNVCYCPPY